MDNDFIALYDEARSAIGELKAKEAFKLAIRKVLSGKKRVSKTERAWQQYEEESSRFVPRIVRRTA